METKYLSFFCLAKNTYTKIKHTYTIMVQISYKLFRYSKGFSLLFLALLLSYLFALKKKLSSFFYHAKHTYTKIRHTYIMLKSATGGLSGVGKYFSLLLCVIFFLCFPGIAQNTQAQSQAIYLKNAGGLNTWIVPNHAAMLNSVEAAKQASIREVDKITISPTRKNNFTSLTPIRTNQSWEVAQYNTGYENDPELGILFANAPCNDCYELIDRRTETQKFFVRTGTDARQFILQTGSKPLHYKDNNGRWRTITDQLEKDNTHTGIYSVNGRPVHVKINTEQGYTSLSGTGVEFIYNHNLEMVYVKPDGSELSLGIANWSSYTTGDDGMRVKDAWPGIDMEIAVLTNGLKTSFVINAAMPMYAEGKLVLRDHLQLSKGLALQVPEKNGFSGKFQINNSNGTAVFLMDQAVAFEQNNIETTKTGLNYSIGNDDVLNIEIPGSLLNKPESSYPLVIDPMATSTVVSGFTYSAALGSIYCTNTANVTIPAAATLTDIQLTYNYWGAGYLWSNSGINFEINGVCATGFLNCGPAFSSGLGPGNSTCGVTNTSLWSTPLGASGTWSSCVPAFNCNSYTLPFQLLGTQNAFNSGVACDNTVFETASGFTVNVYGTYPVATTISPTGPSTLCMPSTLTLTGTPSGGIWGTSAPGVATVTGGVVTGVSNGAATISYTAGGCSATTSIAVGTTPNVTGTTSICFPGTTSLTGSPAGGTWTSSTTSVATVPGGTPDPVTVTAVAPGTTNIIYNTGTCSSTTPVVVESPTGVPPTTQPTLLIFPGTTASGGIIKFTTNGSDGYLVVASTFPTLSSSPLNNTTYATGSSFGGGIVVNGSTAGSTSPYVTSLLNSNTLYYVFVFAFNNNCSGPQYNNTSPLTGSFNTCILPASSLVTTTIGSNSIGLSWTASPVGGNYISPINYIVQAYVNSSLTTLATGYPISVGPVTSYTASGLAGGTQYWFTVTPSDACGYVSNTATAATNCAGLASIPYLETFDLFPSVNNRSPDCWSSQVENCIGAGENTTVTYCGTINTNHTPGGSWFYGFFPNGACVAGFANQWLISPGFAMTAGTTYTLSFWYRTDIGVSYGTIKAQYSTNGGLPGTGSTTMLGVPTTIGTVTPSLTGWTHFQGNFTPGAGTFYIGFDAQSAGGCLAALDDIEICAVPTVTVSNSTAPYCAPATVDLSSAGTTNATTYAWSGPAAYSSTLTNPILTGIGAGTYTYSLTAVNDPTSEGYGGYCSANSTTTFTVNGTPTPITGTYSVCAGSTTALTDATPGGTWSSSNTAIATVGTSGIVTGVSGVAAVISYSLGGTCVTTTTVTVNVAPSAISGTPSTCVGGFTILSNTIPGGIWSSSVTGVATVNSSGVVTGVSVGTTTITYSTGCGVNATLTVTVNTAPGPITGTTFVCLGTPVNLTDATSGGTWASSNVGVATVTSGGVVNGVSAGTANITYSVSVACIAATTVTVNTAIPSITGTMTICGIGNTTTLTDALAGGTWSTTAGTGSVTVGTGGIVTGVTAGTANVTYSVSGSCYATAIITVSALPVAITGTNIVCVGSTTTLTDGTVGGTWSSSVGAVGTVGSTTGIVNGISLGTTSISYITGVACYVTAIVSVTTTPGTINGTTTVCPGSTTTLTNSVAGGTWSSSNVLAGTVGSTTGIVFGVAGGTTTITYSMGGSCYSTTTVTVYALPSAILGNFNVCTTTTTLLSDVVGGGTWSSSSGNATVGSGTGLVSGVTAGTATITYATGAACYVTATVTVSTTPGVIIGSTTVCQTATAGLAELTAGGTWSTSNGNVSLSGTTGSAITITGVSAGTVTITYSMGGGACYSTKLITVTGIPGPILGPTLICTGSSITLTDASPGGTWSGTSTPPGVVSVAALTGVVTGVTTGTATITYTTGCAPVATLIVTVSTPPAAITGFDSLCSGFTTALTDATSGGTWSSSASGIASVGSTTGIVTGGTTGTATISYSTGCAPGVTTIVTVNANPTTITGISTVCAGLTTTLNSTPLGGTWTSSNGNVAIGSSTGIATGAATGTSTITYTLSSGCFITTVVSVNASPTTITGGNTVCVGLTTTLNSVPAGGTWSSSNGNATIGSSTGIVTGSIAGTSTITYILGAGCSITTIVTVNPNPTTITGGGTVCVGLTTTLNSTPTGGTWASSNGNAVINAATGVVTGSVAGTSIITYTAGTGCIITAVVTVNANPTAITGGNNVCVGLTTTLNSTPSGGTWTSSNGNATINAASGVVTGAIAGTSMITYTVSTGCLITAPVTVNANPTAITGGNNVCVGLTTTLNSTPTGGTWTSSNGNATIDPVTGVVTGAIAGTSTITYTLGTGCLITAPVTVNANPTAITGGNNVCVGLTTTLNSTPTGGTWTSSNGNATINPASGVVTGAIAGTSTITYTVSTGCINTTPVTVNANPTAITGGNNVCVGLTITLNSTPAGGAWSSSNGNATINPATGVVTGAIAGTSTITYTVSTGCLITAPVTVNANPTTITGGNNVCVGLTTTLNSTPAGGAWTSSNGNATINPATGVVTGAVAGTSTITYTLGTGCINTTPVTVNANPSTIAGLNTVCVGLTTTLNSTPAGGTWSSSNGNATINPATGVVTGSVAGTSTITYTVSTGCLITTTVTVNANPTAITGTMVVCAGSTTTLNSTPAGGTWSSSNGNATINPATGVVTGAIAGTSTITYTLGTGCINTAVVTVNITPTPITGITTICAGTTTTLNSTPAGGTWSSSNGNATIGSNTGIVTGALVGTSTITYVLGTGCLNTTVVNVSTTPTPITGTFGVCVGLTTTLNSTPGGGGWSSSNGNALIGSTTGVVTGAAAGTSTITYSLGTGCTVTATVTVNANPTAITGSAAVCVGLTTTLNSTPAGGTWSSSNGNAAINPATGVVTGAVAGTSVITYLLNTGCIATTTVTINANPTAITGTLSVCIGLTTTLNSTPAGGTWTSSNGNAIIDAVTGMVTGSAAGTSVITYTLGTGCINITTVTINANPTTITGITTVCAGLTTTLNSTPTGGTWTSSNGNANIGASSGVVTGILAGTSNITYTLSTGCIVTAPVTVNPLPSAISGTLSVCVGSTVVLTDGGSGSWSMSNGNAIVGSSSGAVTGITAGTDVVTYTLPTGCIITSVATVNPLPAGITGTLTVCSGSFTPLTDLTLGGTWSSSATGIAFVSPATGVVMGGAVGVTSTATITYSLSTGCIATAVVTVNPLPAAITGPLSICVGLTTTLTDATAGGTWSSSNGNATVGTGAGIVTGVTGGTSTITYALPTGCIATAVVTVNSLPGAILGTLSVCSGLTTSLSDSPGGGTWSSSATGIATVGSTTGIVTGGVVLTTGTATITYTIGTGCTTTTTVTVNPLPTAILGTLSVCSGLTTSLTDATGGGTWSSSATGIATVGSSTGLVTGGVVGAVSTATITYTIGTGCIMTAVVTVDPLPTAILGTLSVCSGLTTSLSDAATGGTWSSSAAGVASIGSTTGLVTGGVVGVSSTATITYTLPTGCLITAVVTVNPLPTAILGTLTVCPGLTTSLSDASAGGTWSSSTPSVATIGVGTGVVTGVSAGTSGITYVLPTGCLTTAIVTVNPLPGTILGSAVVCQGLTTSLSDLTSSGTWSSSNSGIASVSVSGFVTGTATGPATLTATITYTLPTGCISTIAVTVNPLPAAIMGTMSVCSGLTVTLSDITTGGTWSSSAPGIASVTTGTGVVTGGTLGTATITYTLPTGCIMTTTVTTNPLPAPITGALTVCVGLTTTLSDITAGGTWSSSNTNALVGSNTGIVTGNTGGLSIITYTIPTGCISTVPVTVNPLPAPISGNLNVCMGLTTSLTDVTPGGVWSSSNLNASIGATTGILTGVNVGTSSITYKLVTGCIKTAIATINPLPAAITGTMNVCVNLTTMLSDATSGGSWSSSNTSIGTVGSVTGGVTGINPGTVTITYTLPTGCISTAVVTVNPIPGAIFGVNNVCLGQTITMSDETPSGVWSSSNSTIASIGTTAGTTIVVTGANVGTATISYTLSAGCSALKTITVNPLPAVYAVTGGGSYCEGGAGVHIGLNGSNVGISYLLYYGASATGYLAGTGSALDFGLLTVAGTYTVRATNNTTGCTSNMSGSALVTITPTVNPMVHIAAGPGDTVCPGTTVVLSPDTANAGSAPTYKWRVNGVLVSTSNTYTYIPANSDTVSVIMTSNGVCVMPSTATNTLIMHVIPDGNPMVRISIDPGDTVCEFAAATFTATPTFGGNTPVYAWHVNSGSPVNAGPIFSYYPTTGDIVYCTMTSDYQCRLSDTASSNVAVMTVSPLIIPHVDIVSSQGFDIIAGQYDTLHAVATDAGNNPAYQWLVNGVPVNGATSATFISQFNNYDSISCMLTSSGVCAGISTFDWVYITVHPVGVQQYTANNGDIRLQPNPNTGTFTIRGTLGIVSDEELTIEVTDMIGQVVYSNKVMVRDGKINEQIRLNGTLTNGMYLLNLRSASDNKVFHFVVEQ